jgi:anti-anti-sigma factor
MIPPLPVRSEPLADGLALVPEGDIDLSRSPEMRKRIKEALDGRPKRLVLDLGRVNYMDSSGVATLVEALQRSRTLGCTLVICSMQPKVRSIFEIARLMSVFKVVASRAEAETA